MKKHFLIFIFFYLNTSNTSAIEIDSIYIGDQIKITTEGEINQDSIIRIIPNNIKIISDSIYNNEYTKIHEIKITCYDSGLYLINQPDALIKFNLDTLYVNNMKVDMSKDIKDIAPVIEYKYSIKDYIKILSPYVIILITIIILLFVLRKFIKGKTKKHNIKTIKKIPAHIKATKKLDKLKASDLIKNKKYKLFHSILSEILRKYMEEKFIIQAMESPTYLIIKKMKSKIDSKDLSVIKNILQISDLIKYAKALTDEKESMKNIEKAYDFIKNTSKHE